MLKRRCSSVCRLPIAADSSDSCNSEVVQDQEYPYFSEKLLKITEGSRQSMIDFLELGDPNGTPMIFFHGLPDTKHHARRYADTARKLGIRLIAPNMYGFGKSKTNAPASIETWNRDIQLLLQQLNITAPASVGAVGISGGAMLSLVSTQIPQIAAVGAINGPGPLQEATEYHRIAHGDEGKNLTRTQKFYAGWRWWITQLGAVVGRWNAQFFANRSARKSSWINKVVGILSTVRTMAGYGTAKETNQQSDDEITRNAKSFPYIEELEKSGIIPNAIEETRDISMAILRDLKHMDAGKYLSIVRQPWKKIARGITKPVELLYGEDDPYRLSGLYLKKFVPGAHGHWQDHKGGHFPPKEAWEGSRDGDTQLPGIFERVRDAVIAQNAQSEQTKNPS